MRDSHRTLSGMKREKRGKKKKIAREMQKRARDINAFSHVIPSSGSGLFW